jgi:hypothetical protein
MTTMSPGASAGSRTCSTYARKLAPLIGPSMTQGAVSRSQRSAASQLPVLGLELFGKDAIRPSYDQASGAYVYNL